MEILRRVYDNYEYCDSDFTNLREFRTISKNAYRFIREITLSRLEKLPFLMESELKKKRASNYPCLKHLSLCENNRIDNDTLVKITSLKSLFLDGNQQITNACLKKMTWLERLHMGFDNKVDSNALNHGFTRLNELEITVKTKNRYHVFNQMVSLTSLDVTGNSKFSLVRTRFHS